MILLNRDQVLHMQFSNMLFLFLFSAPLPALEVIDVIDLYLENLLGASGCGEYESPK